MAELGVSAIESFLRLYLLLFLTTKVGLSPAAAGYAVSIGILWDAFADPIIGQISDKTRSRCGPRLPWIAAGAPLLGLAFVLIFRVGHIDEVFSPSYAFLYVTLLNIILNTAMSIVSVPHLALGGELAPHNAERRTSIYAWRSAMTLLGFLVGILIPASVNALGYELANADFIFAVVIALIMLVAVTITIISCRKNTSKAIEEISSPRPVMGSIVRGNVALAGDASHVFLPFTSQGANSALVDAQQLAEYILGSTNPAEVAAAFARYQQERQPVKHRYLSAGRALARGFVEPVADNAFAIPLVL